MSDTFDYDLWLQYGLERRWIGPAVCLTHDGYPQTEAEDDAWNEGDDPCLFMHRLYDSAETADAVEANHPPSVWRKPYGHRDADH